MYVWGVNSTVTKHSDYVVWKDTSERKARRCDVTVDKKRVNSCVLQHLFCKELSNKKIAKKPRQCFLRRAANVTFSKFRADTAQNKTALRAVFWLMKYTNSVGERKKKSKQKFGDAISSAARCRLGEFQYWLVDRQLLYTSILVYWSLGQLTHKSE